MVLKLSPSGHLLGPHESPVIQGQLTRLAVTSPADYPALKGLLNDAFTMASLRSYFGEEPWTNERVEARYQKFAQAKAEGTGRTWAVYSIVDSRLIGDCGFKHIDSAKAQAEFGVIVHSSVWGQGHAAEVLLMGCAYGFDILNLQRIYMHTDAQNERANGMCQKLGLNFSGKTPEGYNEYEIMTLGWPRLQEKLIAELSV